MATSVSMGQTADVPTLKRAFAPDLVSNTFLPSKKCERDFSFPPNPPYSPVHSQTWPPSTSSRSPRSAHRFPRPRRSSMVQASSRTFTPPMPTFMSVFGQESTDRSTNIASHRSTGPHGSTLGRPASSGNMVSGPTGSNAAFPAFHVHRDSTSTLASESPDSSPTTTISTMDSSSVTDPSPGPSPESPVAKALNTSFVADFRSRRPDNGSGDSSPNTFFELQRPTTPAKKPRNLKNLGINTSTSLNNLRTNTATTTVTRDRNTSAPASPSFIKPPTPPKRRPSNLSLTIQTPGSDSKPMRLVIPSNPAINRPALRHFQSSPSLPLCSPSVSLHGPMRLPPLRPIKTNPHGFAEVPQEQEEEDQEPNFDIPQSREEKPAAYPNGPICIYESGVYLYFEPTAAQATEFDVIVNVASEVKNPFTIQASDSQKDLDARRVDGPPAENVDFATLPERSKSSASPDTQASSPTTPKATPSLETIHPKEYVINGVKVKTPEYIHMPWEHNTDIVPDLYKLVKMMDDRVKQGKRILVHCQCGVSRSASLIVAYGLYKNPGISVQEAYDSVKKRSRWIGPNMNLIMQLQEFRNGLLRAANENRGHNSAFGFPRRSAGLSTGVPSANRHSPYDREASSGSRTPRTAPLPPDTDMNMQRASTGNMMSAISPGPLSAPSGQFFSPDFRRSWASSQTHFDLSPKSSPKSSPKNSPKSSPKAAVPPIVDPKGHLVPTLSIGVERPVPLERPHSSADGSEIAPLALTLSQPPVPNFSRQLPFRMSMANDSVCGSSLDPDDKNELFLTAPSQPNGLEGLRSPMVSSFNIPPLSPIEGPRAGDKFPPSSMEFKAPWGRDQSFGPSTSQPQKERQIPAPLASPTATGFNMAPLKEGNIDNTYDLLSPRASTFPLSVGQHSANDREDSNPSDFEVTSPIATEFPKDPFANSAFAFNRELQSPRSMEFHMAPLKPNDPADGDPFGLTSPTRFGFPGDPLELRKPTSDGQDEDKDRRPSFQAILPPSHAAFNGFASLNGTAQPAPDVPEAMDRSSTPKAIEDVRMEDVPQSEPQRPGPPLSSTSEPIAANVPKVPDDSLLPAPPRLSGVRTRFSSPNMREQRKLHKLQTEMEAMLPNRQPLPQQTVDDLDALMSPRAEEFTRNPFHLNLGSVELMSPTDETSPASSIETIRGVGPADVEWMEPDLKETVAQYTPQKLPADPRSPVQPGGSPIVRNIWDVL